MVIFVLESLYNCYLKLHQKFFPSGKMYFANNNSWADGPIWTVFLWHTEIMFCLTYLESICPFHRNGKRNFRKELTTSAPIALNFLGANYYSPYTHTCKLAIFTHVMVHGFLFKYRNTVVHNGLYFIIVLIWVWGFYTL